MVPEKVNSHTFYGQIASALGQRHVIVTSSYVSLKQDRRSQGMPIEG